MTGLYSLGATCSNKTRQTYGSLYDAWGNVTSRTVNGTSATLSYYGLDHLTRYDAGSNRQEQYVYDASGERVLRRSTSSGITSMTVYAFGLEEHLYDGTGVHQNQSDTYYYLLGGMLVGESVGTNTNMFLTDALGSVIETISATANAASVQGNQVYSPYGSSRYQQGSLDTTKGFTGQYNDGVTGLDYYGARYYDPVVGRFLSVDTVQGNIQGRDPYAHVGGNPETFSDPSGQRYAPPPGGGSSSPSQPVECFTGFCHEGGGSVDTGGKNGDQSDTTTNDTTVNLNNTTNDVTQAQDQQGTQATTAEQVSQLQSQLHIDPNTGPEMTTFEETVWVTNLVTGSVYQHRSLATKGAGTVHCWQDPFAEQGGTVMEVVYYAARANLRRLMRLHPQWTHKQYAQAVGMSQSWVKKWKKRLEEAEPEDEQVLHSRSRARKHPPERVSEGVVDCILQIRDEPPEGLQRTPGPRAILYYLPRDPDLQAERLPRSSRTIYRILQQAGRIAHQLPHMQEELSRPAPMSHWQLDFKDAATVPADPDGKRQHMVEVLNVVDEGTSVLVDAHVGADFHAETTLEAVADLFVRHGLPEAVRMDRDVRFVSSPSGSDFPSALVRFCQCLGVGVLRCDPHHPQQMVLSSGITGRFRRNA